MKEERKSNTRTLLWITALVALAFWGANWFLLSWDQQRGTIGDMFGVTNGLFSAGALVLVFYAMRLQTEELQDNREVAKQSAVALEKQNKITAMSAILNGTTACLRTHTELALGQIRSGPALKAAQDILKGISSSTQALAKEAGVPIEKLTFGFDL